MFSSIWNHNYHQRFNHSSNDWLIDNTYSSIRYIMFLIFRIHFSLLTVYYLFLFAKWRVKQGCMSTAENEWSRTISDSSNLLMTDLSRIAHVAPNLIAASTATIFEEGPATTFMLNSTWEMSSKKWSLWLTKEAEKKFQAEIAMVWQIV